MGILTAYEIKKRIETKEIIIDPFDDSNLGANSYDLTLGNRIKVYQSDYIDLRDALNNINWVEFFIPPHGFLCEPNHIFLVSTKEYTETHNLVPMIKSKSSIARNGISLPLGAGFGDIGFKGNWTIPLVVTVPVRIYPNMKFCQIYFETVEGLIRKTYEGVYQNSRGIAESRMVEEQTKNKVMEDIKNL